MTFSVVFDINPPGVFGLAEARTTVIPPTSGSTLCGFVFDRKEHRVIDRTGETSIYRADHEKIDVSLKLGEVTCRVLDNTMTLDVEAENCQDAYSKTSKVVDIFLKHLEVNQGLLFKTRAIKIEECGNPCPIPASVSMGSLRIYNLNRLRDDIREAERSWVLSDDRLERALEYFEHALFLFETANALVLSSRRHSALCVSESFLNLWKSATSLVGDPGVRKDDHQKRCSRLGLDDAQKATLTRIRRLRNDCDVAHYSLSPDRMRVVQKEFGAAMTTVREIVHRYKQYLRKGEEADPSETASPGRTEG